MTAAALTTDRLLEKAFALTAGYFWKPCPVCRTEFGGHEWRQIGGHRDSIPDLATIGASPEMSTGICPTCTVRGVGCYVAARLGSYLTHECDETRRAFREMSAR